MKRLLLISPVVRTSLMGSDFYYRLPPLGLLKVASLTPPNWQVTISDEKVEPLDLEQDTDLVGITAMTPTVNRAYEIADHFRRRGIKVVMGGMHVSNLPEESLAHCDAVLVGEAEELWPRLLDDFDRNELKTIYRHENGFPSLDGLPLPNWDMYRPKPYLPVHFVETTRGCPWDCEFCAVTNAFGGCYRNRPCEEVIRELRSLRPFTGLLTLKNVVFFVDDNIVSNRVYAREFLTRIADLKLQWFGQASLNIARDDEILRLCQKSGCQGVFIGFETLSTETMRSIGKKPNRPEQYFDLVKRIHDHGIGIDASFVFGFDTDDEAVFDRTLDFVIRAKIDIAYFSILTPYPGTRLYRRMVEEDRLLTRDWSYYDANHVVYRPKTFTPDRLLENYHRVLKGFYTVSSIFRRLWGSQTRKNFFYPMNFGFRQSVKKQLRTLHRIEESTSQRFRSLGV